jgi:hypothetical protein
VKSALSLYRFHYKFSDADRFYEILKTFRPQENKVQRIVPGPPIVEMDVILTEEELSFMKLSIQMNVDWLQEWTHRDERR